MSCCFKKAIKIDKMINHVFSFRYHYSSLNYKLTIGLLSCLNTLEHPRKSKTNLWVIKTFSLESITLIANWQLYRIAGVLFHYFSISNTISIKVISFLAIAWALTLQSDFVLNPDLSKQFNSEIRGFPFPLLRSPF